MHHEIEGRSEQWKCMKGIHYQHEHKSRFKPLERGLSATGLCSTCCQNEGDKPTIRQKYAAGGERSEMNGSASWAERSQNVLSSSDQSEHRRLLRNGLRQQKYRENLSEKSAGWGQVTWNATVRLKQTIFWASIWLCWAILLLCNTGKDTCSFRTVNRAWILLGSASWQSCCSGWTFGTPAELF